MRGQFEYLGIFDILLLVHKNLRRLISYVSTYFVLIKKPYNIGKNSKYKQLVCGLIQLG